jgi:hypothetical protein
MVSRRALAGWTARSGHTIAGKLVILDLPSEVCGQTPIPGNLNSVRQAERGLIGLEVADATWRGSFSSIGLILLAAGFRIQRPHAETKATLRGLRAPNGRYAAVWRWNVGHLH